MHIVHACSNFDGTQKYASPLVRRCMPMIKPMRVRVCAVQAIHAVLLARRLHRGRRKPRRRGHAWRRQAAPRRRGPRWRSARARRAPQFVFLAAEPSACSPCKFLWRAMAAARPEKEPVVFQVTVYACQLQLADRVRAKPPSAALSRSTWASWQRRPRRRVLRREFRRCWASSSGGRP